MHLCFLDESGTPPKPSAAGKGRYFVIAGVIMHEAQWHGIATDLAALCKRPEYRVTGEIKWRYFFPKCTDPDNSVAHLSEEVRNEFRRKLFELITARKSVKIVACVTCVDAAYEQSYINTEEDLYTYTYKPVTERFQYYLQDVSRVVGDKQLGIVVADHRGRNQDDALRKKHAGLVGASGAFSSKYGNYVETVFLTPSHHSVGIQLADMVAGAIGRTYNAKDKFWMPLLRSAFRASATGAIDGFGLVKFPKESWR
jgi:hypothetical protein